MKNKKRKRSRQFSFVVSEEEYKKITHLAGETTCKSVNDYARSVTLQRPVVVKVRHETAEQFLQMMLPVKEQLEQAAKTFIDSPQAEKDPIPLAQQIEELRSLMLQCYQQCMR